MRFLITGAAGFVGAALANRLADDGHEVLGLDDLSRGDRTRLSPRVRFTQGDVNDIPGLWTLLPGVDCVYHLAARVSVAESLLYPRDYNAVNVGGTVSLMEAMRDAGVRRVVLASSGAVYGAQARQPVDENAPPRPDSPYAVSKWAAEQYVHTIGALWGIETVALRIFNTYGPGQPLPISHPPVVARFVQQALTGGSVVIFGDGRQSRDFVYLTDVVQALMAAATARQVNRMVINIGSGVETAINTLVDTLERVSGRPLNRLYNANKTGGVARLTADISRAQGYLGYRPQMQLGEGLALTMQHDERFRAYFLALTSSTK